MLIFGFVIRSTPPSGPNKASLDVCPSVHMYAHPSTESFSDSNEIWCVGRGRVMHESLPPWPNPRSRSSGVESYKFFQFQNLSPPFSMEDGK